MSAPTTYRVCSVPDCDQRVDAHQKCGRHYKAHRRGGDPKSQGFGLGFTATGDTSWQTLGVHACRTVDPEIFYPLSEKPDSAPVRAAKAICQGCPVRARCLAWAMDALTDGIAGGFTSQERRGMRRNGSTR